MLDVFFLWLFQAGGLEDGWKRNRAADQTPSCVDGAQEDQVGRKVLLAKKGHMELAIGSDSTLWPFTNRLLMSRFKNLWIPMLSVSYVTVHVLILFIRIGYMYYCVLFT